MQSETKFFVLQGGTDGIRVGDYRRQTIQDWPPSKTLSDLRSVAGQLKFYRRFIYRCSEILAPLTDFKRKRRSIPEWDSMRDAAFNTVNSKLTSSPVMKAPDWSVPV